MTIGCVRRGQKRSTHACVPEHHTTDIDEVYIPVGMVRTVPHVGVAMCICTQKQKLWPVGEDTKLRRIRVGE